MANNFSNSINSTIGASNSGATNTLTVTNPSNTASSQALVNVTVGGTSAGDAFTTYTVAGTTNWSQGVDNSASDAFVIAASNALGTTNVVSMATGGNVSVVLGDLDVTRSSSGATVTSTISNTSNTASSNALFQHTVAGTSAGDAFQTFTVSGTTNWSQGIDNSVTGDPFVISASTALGTTNVMSAATSGAINYPLQPAFLVSLSSTATDVTGNNANYTVLFDSEVSDQGGNFNNTTGVFTAPVTGLYRLSSNVFCDQIAVTMTTLSLSIVTSNRNYIGNFLNPGACKDSNNRMIPSIGSLCDMDAADTASIIVNLAGGPGNTVDVLGSTNLTFFSGSLLV